MKPRADPAVPLRIVSVLTAVVLGVHLLLLQARPGPLTLASPWAQAAPMLTRTVTLPPARPSPPAAPPRPPEVAAAPAPRAATQAPSPAELPRPAPEPAPAAPPVPSQAAAPEQQQPEGTVDAVQARVPNALAIPTSVRLRYKVFAEYKRLPLTGSAALTWRQNGEQYDARLEIAMLNQQRQQASTGTVTADGLAPQRFSERARGEQAAHFEREAGRISFSGNTPSAELLAGAQDRLSVLLQLSALVAGDPSRYPPGSAIRVQTAGAREADVWTFEVVGVETLDLPGGRQPAIKLQRLPRREFDVKVELWLGMQQEYLPVRVRLTQHDGDIVDQQWESSDRG